MYLLCKKKAGMLDVWSKMILQKSGFLAGTEVLDIMSPEALLFIFIYLLFCLLLRFSLFFHAGVHQRARLFHSSPCDVFTQLTKIWKLSRIFIRCLLRRVLFLKENAQNIVNRRNMESTSRSGDQMWWMSIDGISWKGVGFVILRYVDLKRQCLPGGWW